MAFDLHPVNAGTLAGLAEKADAAGFERVVRPIVRLLALYKGAEPVALHVHGYAVWSVGVDHHAQRRLHPGAPAAPDHRIANHGHRRPRPRLQDREFHGVVVVGIGRPHDPIDALAFDLRQELKAVVRKRHRGAVER